MKTMCIICSVYSKVTKLYNELLQFTSFTAVSLHTLHFRYTTKFILFGIYNFPITLNFYVYLAGKNPPPPGGSARIKEKNKTPTGIDRVGVFHIKIVYVPSVFC